MIVYTEKLSRARKKYLATMYKDFSRLCTAHLKRPNVWSRLANSDGERKQNIINKALHFARNNELLLEAKL